ncbi:MAG TPA: histidine phosphatase family protein [Natronosporangium sp.]
MPDTTVLLCRHGQTAWHRPNRYTGASDLPLDATGRAQAEALARRAGAIRPTSLACSPLVRATETIAPVADATGLPVRVDARLRELDFGIAEGRTLDQLHAERPDVVERFLADPVAHHFPGGEPPAEAVARAEAALRDLVAADPAGTVLVVAHSTLIRLLVCATLGVPLRDYRRRLPRLDPVAVTRLSFPDGNGQPALLTYNAPILGG